MCVSSNQTIDETYRSYVLFSFHHLLWHDLQVDVARPSLPDKCFKMIGKLHHHRLLTTNLPVSIARLPLPLSCLSPAQDHPSLLLSHSLSPCQPPNLILIATLIEIARICSLESCTLYADCCSCTRKVLNIRIHLIQFGLEALSVCIVRDSFHVHQKVKVTSHVLVCEFEERVVLCPIPLPTRNTSVSDAFLSIEFLLRCACKFTHKYVQVSAILS